MPCSCVCGGGSIEVSPRPCPLCGGNPVIYQESFGGYITTGFCGSCGSAWQDGEELDQSNEDRKRIIAWVRKVAANNGSTKEGR